MLSYMWRQEAIGDIAFPVDQGQMSGVAWRSCFQQIHALNSGGVKSPAIQVSTYLSEEASKD